MRNESKMSNDDDDLDYFPNHNKNLQIRYAI